MVAYGERNCVNQWYAFIHMKGFSHERKYLYHVSRVYNMWYVLGVSKNISHLVREYRCYLDSHIDIKMIQLIIYKRYTSQLFTKKRFP